MTEDEAKTKWCPFARTARSGDDFSANRDRDGSVIDVKHTCIASACMAWHWNDVEFIRTYTPPVSSDLNEWTHVLGMPGANYWTRRRPEKVNGFCGLAGQP